ncbi:MAG: 3-methylornithyl-N6-L-lysine dehydrogenase PylD [Clostridiales Family XIII bacterium]|jgi:pyrrolysine biosynthesis protein PylD|nr:3-methylornithyl-N6-L-lysine dehydrogenase PylD [Clostridiales Family XIII bacterium]
MTRLRTNWISAIPHGMEAYGQRVRALTGLDARALAARAARRMDAVFSFGLDASLLEADALARVKAAFVRVTTGEGVLGGFDEAVAAIASYYGPSVFVPAEADVDGLYQAAARGADLVILADDRRFLALNLRTGCVCENDMSTAFGYAEALAAMAERARGLPEPEGLAGEDVLVLGAGPVGRYAMQALAACGAKVFVYDKDEGKTRDACGGGGVAKSEIGRFCYLLDATNEGGWLSTEMLHPEALIAAPGVPPSLDKTASGVYNNRIFADPLETGTIVMLAGAIARKSMGCGSDGSQGL